MHKIINGFFFSKFIISSSIYYPESWFIVVTMKSKSVPVKSGLIRLGAKSSLVRAWRRCLRSSGGSCLQSGPPVLLRVYQRSWIWTEAWPWLSSSQWWRTSGQCRPADHLQMEGMRMGQSHRCLVLGTSQAWIFRARGSTWSCCAWQQTGIGWWCLSWLCMAQRCSPLCTPDPVCNWMSEFWGWSAYWEITSLFTGKMNCALKWFIVPYGLMLDQLKAWNWALFIELKQTSRGIIGHDRTFCYLRVNFHLNYFPRVNNFLADTDILWHSYLTTGEQILRFSSMAASKYGIWWMVS